MRRTELLQEIRKMRFEEAYEGWNGGRLTQAEAAQLLGLCERSFRRYVGRYEAEGLDGSTKIHTCRPCLDGCCALCSGRSPRRGGRL